METQLEDKVGLVLLQEVQSDKKNNADMKGKSFQRVQRQSGPHQVVH